MKKGKDIRPHIGIIGRRNNGKSSFINTIVNQDIAIVSDQPGTTTDPVKKSIEIFGIGPVILIDTAGIDDSGELGEKRIDKTLEVIKTIDLAILLIVENKFDKYEINLIKEFNKYEVPFIIINNKSDIKKIRNETIYKIKKYTNTEIVEFSTIKPYNLDKIISLIKKTIPESAYQNPSLIGDLVSKGDIVLLITPIDLEAPDARMILPQVMTIRDILDNDCICVVLKETELEYFLKESKIIPNLAVTDSQVFYLVDKILPQEIPLTSFSIVFARLKGDFDNYIIGTPMLSELKDGDKILILESCSHQVNCDDIGRYKIPKWLIDFTKKQLEFEVVAGLNKTYRNIHEYAIVIQCGGCVSTRKQIINRLKPAIDAGIPITNYGMMIAYINGVFERAINPFLSEKYLELC